MNKRQNDTHVFAGIEHVLEAVVLDHATEASYVTVDASGLSVRGSTSTQRDKSHKFEAVSYNLSVTHVSNCKQ